MLMIIRFSEAEERQLSLSCPAVPGDGKPSGPLGMCCHVSRVVDMRKEVM